MAEFPAASPQTPPPSSVAFPQATPASRSLSPLKWAAIVLAALILVATLAAYGAWSSWVKAGRIAPGVSVQGENLAGLSKAEARERLEKRYGNLMLDVDTGIRVFTVSLEELGGEPRIDAAVANAFHFGRSGHLVGDVAGVWRARSAGRGFPLPVHWNKVRLRRRVWALAREFNTKPHDATLQVDNGAVSIVPHEIGRALNVGATCATLQKAYFVGKPSVLATTREVQPRLLAEDLEGRDVKLGSYSTRYNAGLVGRTRNIHVAVDEIDGTVLLPDEEFSFNRATGERTWEKGYRMAHIFERKPGKEEAEVVDGLAGGVCQVSSTLYNAVRRTNEQESGLKIVERNSHSLPVTYVPPGFDATVAWPYKDFRFRNNFPHPVYLRAAAADGRLVISVWGRVKEG